MTWISKCGLVCALLISSCCSKIYNFKGANIPTEVKTISIDLFNNEAAVVNPDLSIQLTEKLKTKFQTQTRLALASQDGDFALSGKIVDYRVEPAILNAGQGTAKNNFTIGIRVKFVNRVDPLKDFEKDYSNFIGFDANEQFSSLEKSLAAEITDNLVQQVFSDIALDW